MLPKVAPFIDFKCKGAELAESAQREQERKLALLEGIIQGEQASALGRTPTHDHLLARTKKGD